MEIKVDSSCFKVCKTIHDFAEEYRNHKKIYERVTKVKVVSDENGNSELVIVFEYAAHCLNLYKIAGYIHCDCAFFGIGADGKTQYICGVESLR